MGNGPSGFVFVTSETMSPEVQDLILKGLTYISQYILSIFWICFPNVFYIFT